MAFPTTPLDPIVEAALGADLTADPSDWVWTDVSDYVRGNGRITITRGGRDGGIQSPPSTCVFVVDNADGRWVPTNPSGAWYGRLVRNTPIRVRTTEVSASVRGTWFLSSLPPRWKQGERDRYVEVTATSILERLQRGKTPLRSPLVRAITIPATGSSTPQPVAYWPGEDGTDATSIAEYYGRTPMQLTGQVVTLSDEGPDGSLPLPEFTIVAGAIGNVATYVPSGSWTIVFVLNFPASPSAETVLLQWRTTGTYPVWQITLAPASPDVLALQAFDTSGTMQINQTLNYATGAVTEPFGLWSIIVANATLNGSNVDATISIFDQDGGNTSTVASAAITAGAVGQVKVHANSKFNGAGEGHWVVWNAAVDVVADTTLLSALAGHAGDTASIRASLLGNEEGIPVVTDFDSLVAMGAQGTNTFLGLLRECEAAANARLFEERDPTHFNAYLNLKGSGDLEIQAVALTLNRNAGQLFEPFDPVDDVQQLRNDWTVTRQTLSGAGSSARVVATEGEHSTLTPAKVGTYDDSTAVNVESDDLLPHQAGWRVNVGTVEGLRFPVVTVDLFAAPALISSWLNCDIGSRIQITNPPPGMAPDAVDLIVEGWTETLDAFEWKITLFCSPYRPWHVFQLANTSGDTSAFLGRLAGDPKCALRSAVTSTGLSLAVDPNTYRWTTAADDFPLNVRLGGEVCTVSSIATTAGTFVAAGAVNHATNAAVSPAIYAGATAGDLICVFAAIGTAGTTGTLSISAGYTRLPVFGDSENCALFAKVHSGSESAPTVTPAGGGASDICSAVTFGLRNTPTTLTDLTDIVVHSLAQLNGSAQDVAYPGLYPQVQGCIVLALAWKRDAWTSVATLSGFTEAVDAFSGAGNEQSIAVDYQIQTTPAVVNGKTFVVTGGTANVSRGAVVAIAAGFQTFTVSARSVNGVVKAQTAATLVAVEDPAVLAL